LYEAGLDADDRIVQLDGKNISSQTDLRNVIEAHKPGDKVSIQFKHRESIIDSEITFSENPYYVVQTFEKNNRQLTPEIVAFRKAWLGSKQ
jgi:predicted metalloprotease with PDZ domain